jgi:hypothetical protein
MRGQPIISALLALLVLFAAVELQAAPKSEQAPGNETVYNFGSVGLKEPVEHTFTFANTSGKALHIQNVQLLPPLVVTKMSTTVAPGTSGRVTVRLGEPRQDGRFKSPVAVNLDDGSRISFWVMGKIVPPVEFTPMRAFFVSVTRGGTKQESIEITNHEKEPLKIIQVDNPSPRFTTNMETLAPGRRYRLTLTLKGEGPAGKQKDEITVVTSSESQPFLKIPAFTFVKERVYVNPSAVDFGRIETQALKDQPDRISFLNQQLMVYQKGGKDFQLTASTDVPFLRLSLVSSPMKDRYQINVDIIPEKLTSGTIDGSIRIFTNDQKIPRLTVPVNGQVDGDW